MHTHTQTRSQAEQGLVRGCHTSRQHGTHITRMEAQAHTHSYMHLQKHRLNKDWCVDATRAGNMAHLLNHSCEPNCLSRTISARHPLTGVVADHVVIYAKVCALLMPSLKVIKIALQKGSRADLAATALNSFATSGLSPSLTMTVLAPARDHNLFCFS